MLPGSFGFLQGKTDEQQIWRGDCELIQVLKKLPQMQPENKQRGSQFKTRRLATVREGPWYEQLPPLQCALGTQVERQVFEQRKARQRHK